MKSDGRSASPFWQWWSDKWERFMEWLEGGPE